MTLGPVELEPFVAAGSPSPLPAWTLAQAAGAAGAAGRDTSAGSPLLLPSLLPPLMILALCVAAGIGTYLLLPGRTRGAGARSAGGALVLLAGLTLGLLLLRAVAVYGAGGPGVYFWVFSTIAILGALRVVTHPRPVYAALYFVLTVFATAGLFILLWAEFMAAALVLIYAGAILVTYVFVIMLAASTTAGGVDAVTEYDQVSRDPLVASAVGFTLMGVLLFVVFDRAEPVSVGNRTFTYVATKPGDADRPAVEVADEVDAPSAAAAQAAIPAGLVATPGREVAPAFSIQALGRYLFRTQAVNLELAGLILTLGMIGAILIARRRVLTPGQLPGGGGGGGRAQKDAFTAPATPISDDPFSIPVYGTDNPGQKAYPET